MIDATAVARAALLYDEGVRLLESRWDNDASMLRYEASPDHHDPRGTLAYTAILLERGAAGDAARAAHAITSALGTQETRPKDAHRGNFRWTFEDEGVIDLNAVEFMLDALIPLLRDQVGRLSRQTAAAVRNTIALGLEEIDRLDVHASYTNIALSDICNSVLGGQVLGDPRWVERGRRRLDEWWAFTNRSGGPHEFNSPTYCAVDIMRVAALAELADDPAVQLKARVAEERLWLHVAAHYHDGVAQLAGPHSRSYRDGWTGASGYLKLILWRLLGNDDLRRATPFFPAGREEGHAGIARATFHPPTYALDWLRAKRFPFEARETCNAARGVDITTYMTEDYALGTASRAYAVGEPPEPWPQPNSLLLHFRRDAPPGFGVLSARYVSDDRETHDQWEEGTFVGAQHRNRALLAYGLTPRLRPLRSAKLRLRILGVNGTAGVRIAGRLVEALSAQVQPGEAVVVAEGEVYIALVPFAPTDMGSDAPIEINVAGGMLALDIHNYRGPAKQFWEYRSLGGPFFRGNVRNALALEVASRRDFADIAAFCRHVAAARLTDHTDGAGKREIAYESDGGAVAMRYSLGDMRLIERRYDGAVYVAPMARAGALDGGIQWAQNGEPEIALGGATLISPAAAKWLVADGERERYVCVNPGRAAAPLRLKTPGTVVACDAFGFGRIEVDDATGVVLVETVEPPAALRVRRDGALRLLVDGADATRRLAAADGQGMRQLLAP